MPFILWVDDESVDILKSLVNRLGRSGIRVETATTYADGLRKIEENHHLYESVLLDVIIPFAAGKGALAPDIGIDLAEIAALSGINRIAFLTVTRRSSFWQRIEDLEKQYEDCDFNYYDKLQLLDPSVFKDLVSFLNGTTNNHAT